ncbi:AAA family ATPase [uncultured Sutterella sp.]|uniref:ATP-binding protein n=1 Tax=uncultured Sutterella sp. TaxID=286133 RepID=UPI00262563EC|nr:AAA family ATPase [uncultured Sutterella sp.]
MIPRWAANELYEILKVQRIASVVGPRQCGKTTLVESADIRNADFISLDKTEDLMAARLDPRYLLTRKPGSCVVIDEIQKAPELIGEIKYLVDHDPRPGQFVLTGSADYRKLPHARESLAGRVDFLRLRTFTAAEILGARPCFLEKALAGDLRFDVDPSSCGKPHILDLAIRGGYPRVALETGLPNEARARWFESYIEQQVILDMREQWAVRKENVVRELFPYLAAFSSKLHVSATMSEKLGQNYRTLEKYTDALKAMFLVDQVRAWAKKDYDRPGKAPKLFMTDSGLMAHILHVRDSAPLLLDTSYQASDLVGKLIETWAYNQFAAEADLHPLWTLEHLRTKGHEIDFLLTNEHGAVLGIEIKASESINVKDFQHLYWFGEHCQTEGTSFRGIVLYAGEKVLSFGKNCYAVPFAALWANAGQ